MIKRPIFALLAAVVSGIVLSVFETTVAVGVMCAWACLIFLFFYFSDRFNYLILKFVKPARYGSLIVMMGLVPLLFALSFWRGKAIDKKVTADRAPYLVMHENTEELCILEGRVNAKDFDGKYYILKIDKCRIKGYFENVERPAGGCTVYVEEGEIPKCGNLVRVYGKFYLVEKADNPGEYDLFPTSVKEGIYGRIYAKKLWITDENCSFFREAVAVMAERFEKGTRNVFNAEDSGILISMITGNKGYRAEETEELYRRAGIGHILAISGLHVSLLVLGLWRILKKMAVGRYWAAGLAFSFLLFFLFFTGFAVSTLRAGVMCGIFLLGRLFRRHYDMPSALGLAMIIILLIFPYELHDPAFILSVTAVAGVCFARELGAGPFFGIIVTFFTAPVSAYFFFEIPTYSFLANLIVIPLTGMLLGFGICAGIFGSFCVSFGKFFGGLAFLMLRLFECVSDFFSKLPFSSLLVGRPKWWAVCFAYAFLISFCFLMREIAGVMKEKEERKETDRLRDACGVCNHRGLRGFLIFGKRGGSAERPKNEERNGSIKLWARNGNINLWAKVTFGSLILLVATALIPKGNRITFLSVGQGDCSVFLSEKWNLSLNAAEDCGLLSLKKRDSVVFDCGSTSETEVGKRVLQTFLKSEGIMLIDKITVSHTDTDHISGIVEILENMNVYRNDLDYALRYRGNVGLRTLVMPIVKERGEAYNKLLELAEKKNVKVEFFQAGSEIRLNDRECKLVCLSPFDAKKSENETSLVFFLETPEYRALLMGDAGVETEGKLLKTGKLMELLGEERGSAAGSAAGSACESGFFVNTSNADMLILKVGHHGSRTASSLEFLELVRPDVAVISCGHGNPYGHPHWSVVQALEEVGAEVHRTDREGAVKVN
ncbi:MAG: ComEC/Rec2 family competence protein [Lachnospiraceae bacterium]|nr:ComEC/Rec2 family competence protein [Lachnospiraceae bacterium]